jgi:DNA-binding transcriptional ArsR family regulator
MVGQLAAWMQGEETDLRRLAVYLKALANPNRLALLHDLVVPRPVAEIRLHPVQVAAGENPERSISEQAVRDHLSRLRQVGVVVVQRAERDGVVMDHFVLNHQRLFAIVEELRRLGELRPESIVLQDETLTSAKEGAVPPRSGPGLLLVRGQHEGREFPLEAARRSLSRGWVIGRKDGLAVSLDYDPFVSAEHAEVVADGEGFRILDLRTNRNGTWVNFARLERGESAPLAHGDVVSVGRTHLVFRDPRHG